MWVDNEEVLVSSHSGAKLMDVAHHTLNIIPRYRPDVILLMAQLKWEIEDANADILCVSETWLRPDVETALVNIPGYEIARLDQNIVIDNKLKTGGGLCTYMKNGIVFVPMTG